MQKIWILENIQADARQSASALSGKETTHQFKMSDAEFSQFSKRMAALAKEQAVTRPKKTTPQGATSG